MEDRYNVIFEGKCMPGEDAEAVKAALKTALRTDDQILAHLFSGKPSVIRKNTDAVTAEKYKKLFADAGALVVIQPVAGDDPAAAPSPSAPVTPVSSPPPAAPSPPIPVQTHLTTLANGVRMIITNIDSVPGKTIVEHFGLVSGSTIRAKHIGKDFLAGLKNIVGGELKAYTELLQESRQEAMSRMVEEARQLGANAVVNVRFSTSSVAQGAAELYAYGTAVSVQ
ncbi:YbjQ family protein [Desulfosarcina sp. OttesenSCG-928-G10]|nr:YbjQ family protein [Desulfosarcina sp. OttesenSCG-928-G10]MDL2321257.1 YbjQ family protein [Desulfosarcina sp. OttesenSCG-928-B08]